MTHHRRRLVALALVAVTGCATTPEAAPPTAGASVTGSVVASTSTTTEATTTTSTSTLPPPPPPTAATTVAPAPRPAPPPAPASGPLRSGRATHYRLESSGNCSFPDGPRAGMYVAMNATDYGTADLCGAYLAVQGNRGSVTVRVVDQCPECPPGALDLSPEAFARVTGDAGITNVQWRVVSGPAQPAVSYRIKDGSSQWWVGILAADHRNPVRSLEAMVGGRWVALERQEYNYFLAPKGLGPGPFDVRLTDTFGERIVSSGLTPQAGRVITSGQQFAGH